MTDPNEQETVSFADRGRVAHVAPIVAVDSARSSAWSPSALSRCRSQITNLN